MSKALVFAETCQDEFGLCPPPRRSQNSLAIHIEDHTATSVAVVCDRCGAQLAILNSERSSESVSYLWLNHVCSSAASVSESPMPHAA